MILYSLMTAMLRWPKHVAVIHEIHVVHLTECTGVLISP